jgi:hypothetical protein
MGSCRVRAQACRGIRDRILEPAIRTLAISAAIVPLHCERRVIGSFGNVVDGQQRPGACSEIAAHMSLGGETAATSPGRSSARQSSRIASVTGWASFPGALGMLRKVSSGLNAGSSQTENYRLLSAENWFGRMKPKDEGSLGPSNTPTLPRRQSRGRRSTLKKRP